MQILMVFLCFFIWSSSFTIGRATLNFASPLFITGFRMVAAGLILLAFIWLTKRRLVIKKVHIFPLMLLGFSAIYLTNFFEFWGLQYLTAARASFIYSLTPFISAVLSYFQFKEKITYKKILGLAVGFIGFFPFLWAQGGNLLGGIGFLTWADLALVAATLTGAYGWILMRKLGKDEGMSPLLINGSTMVIGGVFALIHSLCVDSWQPTPVTSYPPFLEGVALMVIVSNLICYNFYGYLLKRFTATFLSFAGLLTPLFAAFFGWIFLKETVSWTFFLSMGIILFGLWLVYAEELRLGYIIRKKKEVPAEASAE